MNILYEDNHVLVVEKPAALPSQMTPDGLEGAEDLLRKELAVRSNKQKQFLHVVHRLDRSASGILLLAKTSKALSRLSQAMREKKMVKRYLAIVEGTPPFHPNQILTDFVTHGDRRALIDQKAGKEATLKILEITPLSNNQTQLLIELISGRYHQIRIQLSSRHFPIIGDTLYGSSHPLSKGAILLHHSFLSFPHPTQDTGISVSSNPSWSISS